jgi:hypothetical protein
MPIEEVAGSALRYHLIAFDDQGRERGDDPAGLMSQVATDSLAGQPVTDVFVFSHGWMADLPAAQRQYGKWVKAMGDSRGDIERLAEVRPGFQPLLVGLHWPSRPWSEEEFGAASFGVEGASAPRRLVDEYAATIAVAAPAWPGQSRSEASKWMQRAWCSTASTGRPGSICCRR